MIERGKKKDEKKEKKQIIIKRGKKKDERKN